MLIKGTQETNNVIRFNMSYATNDCHLPRYVFDIVIIHERISEMTTIQFCQFIEMIPGVPFTNID